MGAWDVGIFDNDTSVDVRAFYEDALIEDEATATAVILERFAEDLDEPEVAPDVWLGLAAAQWDLGRPDPEVVRRALAIVEDGSDVERWRLLDASEEDVRARAAALEAFAERLRGEPPPPSMPVREEARPLPKTRFRVGDVLAYRLPSGSVVPLAVIQVPRTLTSGSAPVCVLIPQAFPEAPTLEAFMTMDVAEAPKGPNEILVSHELDRPVAAGDAAEETDFRAHMIWIVEDEDEDAVHEREHVEAIGHTRIAVSLVGPVARVRWPELPAHLERHFGLT